MPENGEEVIGALLGWNVCPRCNLAKAPSKAEASGWAAVCWDCWENLSAIEQGTLMKTFWPLVDDVHSPESLAAARKAIQRQFFT